MTALHLQGPTVELAAKVKAVLDSETSEDSPTLVRTSYGSFYVRAIELAYGDGDVGEVVGYLVPDEAEGNTFDFWTKYPEHLRHRDIS